MKKKNSTKMPPESRLKDVQKGKESDERKETNSAPPVLNKKLVWGLLIIILIIASILRFWAIDFGLPYLYYIDETKIVKRSKLIANNLVHNKWDIDPQFYQYPTFLTNLSAIEFVIYARFYGYFAVKKGKFQSRQEAIDSLFQDRHVYLYDPYPPIFYLITRINNALAGIFTVLLCFFLSKIAFKNDDRIGLLSAFLLAVMFLHAKHSQYPMADSILAFWTVLAMMYVVKIFTRGSPKDYLLSGLFIGLGTSTKYITILLLPVYLLNIGVTWWKNHGNVLLAKKIIIFALVGLMLIPVSFLIGTPTFLTRFNEYTNKVKSEKQGMGNAESGGKYGSTQRWFFDYFFNTIPSWFEAYTINSLWGAMGIPLLILIAVAFIYFIYLGTKKKTGDNLIYWDFIIFVVIVYTFFSGKGKNRIIRYFVPLAPFLTIIAAKFLMDMADKIPNAWVKMRKGILVSIVAVLIALPTTIRIIRFNRLMVHTDNRVIAGRWFESTVPKGCSIWMPILYPPSISIVDYRVSYYRGQQKTLMEWLNTLVAGLDKNTRNIIIQQINSGNFDLFGLLKKAGFQYVILSSYDYGPCFYEEALKDYPDGTLAFLELHKNLEEKSEWKKVFESNLTDLPGPTIKIYKIN